jgi:hypothetical protein
MIRTLVFSAITLAALGLACAPEATTNNDGGGGSGGGAGGSGGSGAVTYTKDVKPIFAVKCAPCHTTDGQGAPPHNIGTTYADALKLVITTDAPADCFKDGFDKMMPKTVGECTVPAIKEGWMPLAMQCFNTPRPATCVSLDEQAIIEAWVAAGMPQ